jgi:hypothetical protein
VPALRRLQGLIAQRCLHTQITVTLEQDLVLDPERPEYHRAEVFSRLSGSTLQLFARSTGNQRSSRLLSMRSANALLVLPQGPGTATKGSQVTALLLRSLEAPVEGIVHRNAAQIDSPVQAQPATELPQSEVNLDWTRIRVGLLTISDRVSI